MDFLVVLKKILQKTPFLVVFSYMAAQDPPELPQCPWTGVLDHVLFTFIKRQNAHKKTEKSFEDKYNRVINDMYSEPETRFKAFKRPRWSTLEQKWKRAAKAMLVKGGFGQEGGNLSGLEAMGEEEKLVYAMVKDDFDSKQEKFDKIEKDKKREVQLLFHEDKLKTAGGKRQRLGVAEAIEEEDGEGGNPFEAFSTPGLSKQAAGGGGRSLKTTPSRGEASC